jgi:hypothetical protein
VAERDDEAPAKSEADNEDRPDGPGRINDPLTSSDAGAPQVPWDERDDTG